MPSTLAAFGLLASYHPSGQVRAREFSIASGYATAIYQNNPVKVVAAGTLESAAAGERAVGAFLGVEYTDSEGRRRVSNRWTASQTGTEIIAWAYDDPDIVYEIQADATLSVAAMYQQYDWNAPSGNTTTGLGTTSLDVATAAANAGLQVVGLRKGPDNDWGDTYPIVEVRISEHQYRADVASV